MKRLFYELTESWRIAVAQMRSNMTRSGLTALGVAQAVWRLDAAPEHVLARLVGRRERHGCIRGGGHQHALVSHSHRG